MDRSFQAGLHQAWEKFFYDKRDEYFGDREESSDDSKTILDFDAIAPIFVILAVGFGIAFLMLLWEVFHRDFVAELKEYYSKKKIKKMLRRKRKIRPRRIKVKPAKEKSKRISIKMRRKSL